MFAHLHTHTEYSLLDGLSKIPDLVSRAAEMGQEALAITDHGALHGAIEFYEAATSAGVKPIIGIEAYVAPGSRFEKDPKQRWPYHLTLLAQNEVGYRNLLQLSSASHLEGFYYRPRMDRELLEAHSEGLIALSGCPSGELMMALREDDETRAEGVLGWFSDVFKDRYYIELMSHGIEEFEPLYPRLIELSKRFDLPTVLTNDSHYTDSPQHRAHEVLLCIGSNSTIHDEGRFRLNGDTFYLRSEAEMRTLFPDLPEAADNTWRIAEQTEIELSFEQAALPDPGVPSGKSAREYLRELCEQGVRRRYSRPTDEHWERLRYELDVVAQTGFDEYMLIVADLARFAREQRIPMGVRGSAAASIVLYALDITDIEPLQHNLVFERFLNPERIGMPDVDFDFADDRREEVIRYAAERYGRDRVAQICTFGTLGAKAAIRDTGRALGMDFGAADRVARMVPDQLNIALDDALQQSSELRSAYDDEAQTRELVDTARQLEGVSRHSSTHAAGVVITREPLVDVVPLQRPTRKDADEDSLPTTQYAMAEIEKLKLLKIDFLGLTNLTILGRAVDMILEHRGEAIDLMALPDGDEATIELLGEGETFGVFQMESAGMRRYVMELKPQNIAELAAMVALFRPGPMEHIPTFIDAKHGRVAPHYLHEDLADILDETYGVITYQDQVLHIARRFAGYTLGQAEVMRKAMGKKIASMMVEERERFIDSVEATGYDRKLAEKLFDLIEPFAGYAFNKAHAVCYGTIAYQTAYLKAHYPAEYMAAVLTASGGSQERIAAAIAECTRLGVEVMPPDVNHSRSNFALGPGPDGTEVIRFGLSQIKNVGAGGIEGLIAEREENGPFKNVEDFARRINARDLNRRVLESLAKAGALDSLGDRGQIFHSVERILRLAQEEQKLRETGQTSMFDLFGAEVDTPLPALELVDVEVPEAQLLAWEKEVLGTYVSAHPFREAAKHLDDYVTNHAVEVTAELAGTEVMVAGIVQGTRSLMTRQGKPFAAMVLEDLSGTIELTIWPDSHERLQSLLVEGNVLLARANVRSRNERLTVAVEELWPYDAESGELITTAAGVPARPNDQRAAAAQPSNGRRPQQSPRAPVAPPPGPPRPPTPPGPPGARLRPVPNSSELAAGESEANAMEQPVTTGPRRLLIRMEETTDQGADRRRLAKLCSALRAYPGELPVELQVFCGDALRGRVELREHHVEATMLQELLGELNQLLGVLGSATEAGDATVTETQAPIAVSV
jgi:DNA polymerase-3 subunit alpha